MQLSIPLSVGCSDASYSTHVYSEYDCFVPPKLRLETISLDVGTTIIAFEAVT